MALLSNVHAIDSDADYRDLRYLVLKQLEGSKDYPYLDKATTDNKVTIGIGFNIEGNATLRENTFSEPGIEPPVLMLDGEPS